MTVFNTYSTGTAGVVNGATVINGAGTLWSGINARPGDDIELDGHTVVILDVLSTTQLQISPWPYASVPVSASPASPYKIIWRSPLRYVGGQSMSDVDSLIASLSNPIFSGTVTGPVFAGGSLAASTLTLESTSGVGTTDAIIFKTGTQVDRGRFDTNGYIYINQAVAINGQAQFQLASDTNAVNAMTIGGYNNTTFAVNLTFQKTRGAAPATHVALVSGDVIYNILAYGSDGAAWQPSTRIQSAVDGAVSSAHMPGRLTFATALTNTLTEQMRIASGGNTYMTGASARTTASAANAFINNASSPVGELLRSTSSLRYKTDIEPLDMAFANAMLNLNPIWYRSLAPADDPKHSFYGYGAEDVGAIDERLCHWSFKDDDYVEEYSVTHGVRVMERKLKPGAKLVPDSVMYDRIAILQIAALKARIEKLENQQGGLQ